MKRFILALTITLTGILLNLHCSSSQNEKLPIFGARELTVTEINGQKKVDTLYHTIAPFSFINQDGQEVTHKTLENKIYVADFFFTSCRTICPKMKTQMLRVYDSIQNMDDVVILSHTIDPEHDDVARLHDFAERLGVKSSKWHFVTGERDSIYNLAQTSYFVTAMEDKTEPDGFIHSGAFLLIDKQRRIRGKYDGTSEEDVNRLIRDIHILRKEYARRSD
ncbi:MAG: SCO family protein [Cyclobacteriaceae bacterium]|nr:SCO family protein [Cyclobacteriaceae bacterium]